MNKIQKKGPLPGPYCLFMWNGCCLQGVPFSGSGSNPRDKPDMDDSGARKDGNIHNKQVPARKEHRAEPPLSARNNHRGSIRSIHGQRLLLQS